MSESNPINGLLDATMRYFDLMYDCDITKFDQVFSLKAQLHGIRSEELTVWTTEDYKKILEERKSPKSLGARREDSILLVDFASPTQALVKVRVLINNTAYIDYLTLHLVRNSWLITSKAYHIEIRSDATPRIGLPKDLE